MMRLRAAALVMLGCAGCTYDFVVGPVRDASAPADAEADGGVDAAPPPSCGELAIRLQRAKDQVTRCASYIDCTGKTLTDECDCTIPVSDATGDAAVAFVREVEAFKATSCPTRCTQCPDSTAMDPTCNFVGTTGGYCEWF